MNFNLDDIVNKMKYHAKNIPEAKQLPDDLSHFLHIVHQTMVILIDDYRAATIALDQYNQEATRMIERHNGEVVRMLGEMRDLRNECKRLNNELSESESDRRALEVKLIDLAEYEAIMRKLDVIKTQLEEHASGPGHKI